MHRELARGDGTPNFRAPVYASRTFDIALHEGFSGRVIYKFIDQKQETREQARGLSDTFWQWTIYADSGAE